MVHQNLHVTWLLIKDSRHYLGLFFKTFLFYLAKIHLAENLDANFMCIKISEFPSKIIMGMLADPSVPQVWVGGTTVYIRCHGIFVQ